MKRFLLSLMGLSVALFMACSSDDSAPVVPQQGGGETTPGGDPTPGGDSGSSQAPDVSNDTYYTTLPATNEAGLQALYAAWVQKFYVTAEEEIKAPDELGDAKLAALTGSARIKFDEPLNTVSEGIGYGMLITYFMKDWDKFDRIFKYYRAYPVSAASGYYFMKWKVSGDKYNGGFVLGAQGGSATDADLDVVTALLLAYAEKGSPEYLDYALKVANSIYMTEINATTNLLMPGNSGGHMADGYCYNISYFSLVGLRLLAKYDTEHSAKWNEVLAASKAYMKKVQDASYGLWPDWSDANGNPISPENSNNPSSTSALYDFFGLESVRIPLRLIWDYSWFGDETTKAMASKAAQYIYGQANGDIMNVLARYKYAGEQPTVGLGGAHFKGVFCALWTVNPDYANSVNTCRDVVLNASIKNYFETSLQLLSSLYLNGYFVKHFNY